MTQDITSITQKARYSNLPVAQLEFLRDNASSGARVLYEKSYQESYKSEFIIQKPSSYFAQMLGYSVRHIKRLWRELESLECVEIIGNGYVGGSLSNKYALKFPDVVIQQIELNPRKVIHRGMTKMSSPPTIIKIPKPAKQAACSEGGDDKNVTPHIIHTDNTYKITSNNTYNDRDLTPARETVSYEEQLIKFGLSVALVSNPKEFCEELKFYFKQLVSEGRPEKRAYEIVVKLVNEDKWRTPFGMRYGETEVVEVEDPDVTLPIHPEMSKLFKDLLKPIEEVKETFK